MKITVNHEVTSCRDCPYSTNSSIEHDDPFVSAPYPIRWKCRRENGPGIISNPFKIDPDCPENKR